jgi:hypothetical protein
MRCRASPRRVPERPVAVIHGFEPVADAHARQRYRCWAAGDDERDGVTTPTTFAPTSEPSSAQAPAGAPPAVAVGADGEAVCAAMLASGEVRDRAEALAILIAEAAAMLRGAAIGATA